MILIVPRNVKTRVTPAMTLAGILAGILAEDIPWLSSYPSMHCCREFMSGLALHLNVLLPMGSMYQTRLGSSYSGALLITCAGGLLCALFFCGFRVL